MRKNRWLVFLSIIAVLCLVIGGGLIVAGKAMGGNLDANTGNWTFYLGKRSAKRKGYQGPVESKTISLESFDALDIDLSMADVEIKIGTEASLRLIEVPENFVKFSYSGSVLRIYNDRIPSVTDFGGIDNKVILTIPDKEYDSLDVELSMGKLEIENVDSGIINVEGSMTSISIGNAKSQKLTVQSSMGEVNVSGTYTGEIKISNSMGNIELTLFGDASDYRYALSNSMGSIKYDGKKLDGLSSEASGNLQAPNSITLTNNMGDIEVKFR